MKEKSEKKSKSNADDALIDANRSIKSIRLDIELLRFISSMPQPVRMRTITAVKPFCFLSESTVRSHLKRLVSCRCLEETTFRGSYIISEQGFDDFCDVFVRHYLRRLIGEELHDTVMRRLRKTHGLI